MLVLSQWWFSVPNFSLLWLRINHLPRLLCMGQQFRRIVRAQQQEVITILRVTINRLKGVVRVVDDARNPLLSLRSKSATGQEIDIKNESPFHVSYPFRR